MKIAFVDEDDGQRETFSLMLQECLPKSEASPQIVDYPPSAEMSDMKFLIEDNDIVTIVLDEQLKDTGVAKYLGIELAMYLRAMNKKIPIFILTSYPDSDELISNEMSVEDILSKQDLPKRKEVVGARLLRGIDTYVDITSDREERFERLLRKSIDGQINEEEKKEFLELGYLRFTPFQVEEIFSEERISKLNELEEKMREIEQSLLEKK